jgi:hypothetical protein
MPAGSGQVPIVATLHAAWAFYRTNATWFAPLGIALALLVGLVSVVAPLPGGSPPPAGALALFPAYAMSSLFVLSVLRAQGLTVVEPLLGLTLVFVAGLACIAFWTALLRRACAKPTVTTAFGEDFARMTRVFGAIWFLVFILTFVAMIVLSSLLASAMAAAGVSEADLAAAQNDPAAAMALMERGMSGGSGMLLWGAGLAIMVGVAWLFARLALAGPATIVENKALAFGSWRYTRGDGLRIGAIYTAICAPVALFAWLVFSPAGANPNAPPSAEAGMALLIGNFVLIALQTLVAMPLMAGAGAFLYRGLRPPNA